MERLDLAEDLSEDVISRVVLYCWAQDALCFAAASRAVLAAADATKERAFALTFGKPVPSGRSRAQIFRRLDKARSWEADGIRECFSWAAGHGYGEFLARTAEWAAATWQSSASLHHLLNGRRHAQVLPPLWRAAKAREAEAVRLLLELRAEADCSGKGGTSALFWSARHGDVAAVRALLAAGASPLRGSVSTEKRPRYPGGECALSAALQAPVEKPSGARLEALRLMAEALSEVERTELLARRALLAACEAGLVPYVSVLAEHIQIDDEETPLLVALNGGFSEVAELLLEKSWRSINVTLPSGKSALHLAAERGDARLLSMLLRARAQLDAVTSSGRTALHLAVEHDYEQAVRVLCQHEGTKVQHLVQETPNGASPVCLAERRGKPGLILPMLRCYHRHLRERFLAGKLQDLHDRVSDPGLTSLCLKHRDSLFVSEDTSNAKVVTQSGKVASMRLVPEVVPEDRLEKLRRYQRVLEKTRWSGVDTDLVGRGRLRSQLDLEQEPRSRRPASASRAGAGAGAARRPWGSAVQRERPRSSTGGAAFHGSSCPASSQLAQAKEAKAAKGEEKPGKQREAAAMAVEDEMQELMLDFFSERCDGPVPDMYSSGED